MAYSSGFLKDIITVENRKESQDSKWGKDGSGIEWEKTGTFHANVGWQKGVGGMNAGALDVYMVKIVRMRWTDRINARSRVVFGGNTYQIIAETFNPNREANEIQFLMQEKNVGSEQ